MQDDIGRTQIEIFEAFDELLARDDLELIVLDVPIGLPAKGARSCDVSARRMLRKRGCCVFPAPIRPMLSATTYVEAKAARLNVDGKGCSLQAYGILPVVRDVDASMSADLQRRVREGHPEVSFMELAGSPLTTKKRTTEGRHQRLSALEPYFSDLSEQIHGLKRRGAVTDAIDAYAMLFTARRIRDGTAVALPREPETDSRGLRMEIVY
jgi:predicted RNase H-like nuclease